MSWYTEVFIAATNLENLLDNGSDGRIEDYPAIQSINDWLLDNNYNALFLIRHPEKNRHSLDACFAGNYNGLNRDGFIEACKAAPWRWKEQVQVFLRQEDDKGFIEIALIEGES